jgi:hypothetical protein
MPHVEKTASNQPALPASPSELTNSRKMPTKSSAPNPQNPHKRNSPRNRTQPTNHRNLQTPLPYHMRQQRIIHILAFELCGFTSEAVFEGEEVCNLAEEGSCAAERD